MAATYRFKRIDQLTRLLSFLIAITAILALLAAAQSIYTGYLFNRPGFSYAMDHWGIVDPWYEFSLRLQVYLGLGISIGLLATVVGYLFWIFRAAANIRAIRPEAMTVRPGWAVGWHLVPIIWFWMPYFVLRQVVGESAGSDTSKPRPMARTLFRWWMCWLVSSLYMTIAHLNGFMRELIGRDFIPNSPESVVNRIGAYVMFCVFLAAACYYLFRIIREITRAQATMASNAAMVFK